MTLATGVCPHKRYESNPIVITVCNSLVELAHSSETGLKLKTKRLTCIDDVLLSNFDISSHPLH